MSRQKDFEKSAMDFCEDHSHCIYFEDGAEHGYQYAVDKACEFIWLHIGVDMPVRLAPDGQPLAEDFINKTEARVNAANKVVEQFKRFMED